MDEPRWVELSDAEFEREFLQATQAGEEANATEPRAKAVRFEAKTRQMVVQLRNGATFLFPVDLVQGLRDASDLELEDVEITPSGEGLHWRQLDWDCGIPSLLMGVFGSEAWLRQLRAEIARKAGSTSSEAKAAAARANGRKGGRPRKAAP